MKYSFPNQTFGEGDANSTHRSISIELTGSLTYEETDIGPWVATHAPGADSDYETFSTLKNEAIEQLLVELIREQCPSHVQFRTLLAKYGIPYEFFSW